jgi:hypothetical protein
MEAKLVFKGMIIGSKPDHVVSEPILITDVDVQQFKEEGESQQETIKYIIEEAVGMLEQNWYSVVVLSDSQVDEVLKTLEKYKLSDWGL